MPSVVVSMFLHPWAARHCKSCNQYRPRHNIYPGAERPSPPLATTDLSLWSEADGEERAGHSGTACNGSLGCPRSCRPGRREPRHSGPRPVRSARPTEEVCRQLPCHLRGPAGGMAPGRIRTRRSRSDHFHTTHTPHDPIHNNQIGPARKRRVTVPGASGALSAEVGVGT